VAEQGGDDQFHTMLVGHYRAGFERMLNRVHSGGGLNSRVPPCTQAPTNIDLFNAMQDAGERAAVRHLTKHPESELKVPLGRCHETS
jgi:hypothetical protein